MSEKIYTIKESTLVNIANEIREKTATTDKENPLDMPALIRSIVSGGGIIPSGEIEIVENGVVNVRTYETAKVNVPTGVFPEGTLEITENGTKNVRVYENVNVNVPTGVFPEGTLEITENGTFDVTNFVNALVNVSGGGDSVEIVRTTPEQTSAYCDVPTDTPLSEIKYVIFYKPDYRSQQTSTPHFVYGIFMMDGVQVTSTVFHYFIGVTNNWGTSNPTMRRGESFNCSQQEGAVRLDPMAGNYYFDGKEYIFYIIKRSDNDATTPLQLYE